MPVQVLATTDPFLERYKSLNAEQRKAVDATYGPVMVIAGPGTGKTEVLAVRIAALLRSDAQVQPHEILCLTYTDEATSSMRSRLVKIIGPAAHRVGIYTFHAFCNNVIQQNPEYFSERSLQVISDLERADLMRGLIDAIPEGHPLRRYGASPYFDIPRLSSLFEYMKREAVTAEEISAQIDAYITELPKRDEYVYKNSREGKWKKGDLKPTYAAEVQRMEQTRAAAGLFADYTRRMKEAGRYDYADMILWVIAAFEEYPDLLLQYQERYQFILVDEFQDTSGSQSQIVSALASFWDTPNLFVVGDDDQSIYEFQGARIRNITDFYEQYKDSITVVVLPQNYRSSQPILDSAGATIRENKQRLVNQLQHVGITKNIRASAKRFADGKESNAPTILEFANPLQEEAWVVHRIEELMAKNVDLSCVAVLYAQHKQAAGIIGMLERKGIPFNAKKPANVLDMPLVRTLVGMLRYLSLERTRSFSGEGLLFEWMHAPHFGLEPTDIAALALYLQGKEAKEAGYKHIRQLLDNPFLISGMKLRNPDAMVRFGNLLNDWIRQQAYLPLTLLLEKMMYESGLIARTLNSQNRIWDLQAVRTFFEFVKETCTQTPRMGIPELLAVLDRMDEEKIALKFEKVFQHEKGVQFFTAHSAKGHEFEYVFLVGCNKNFWEGKRANNQVFKLPDTVTHSEGTDGASDGEEVARRLFYVAITRAKCHLYVSYAAEGNNGEKMSNSVFVDEISEPETRARPQFQTNALVKHLEWALQPVPPVQIEIGQRRHIERILSQFALSPSTLSQYLRCPIGFYYSSLLRVPVQEAPHFAFGSAVHYALETAFIEMRRADGTWPEKEVVIGAFERAMYSEHEAMTPQEYQRRIEQGRKLLSDYYDERLTFLEKSADIEYKVARYPLHGAIPITGRIDKIERYDDGCVVVDYKTGKPANAAKKILPPSDAEPNGGDYWRQMVFYKILLENAPERPVHVKYGFFDLVEKTDKGAYEPKTVPIFDEDVEAVQTQIYDAWTRIQNHEFDRGCGEPDCYWCDFARRYEIVRAPEEASVMDDRS